MPASPLDVVVRRRGDVAVVDLAGDINGAAEATLHGAYADAVADGAHRIALGFTDVAYINSTGIALLVGLVARARDEGRSLVAFGLGDHYREIFAITRLTDFVPLFDDERAACGEQPTTI